MSAYGEIRYVNAADCDDARRTVEILMEQKSRAFARKGVADIFARPGSGNSISTLATNPKTRHMVHVSRVEIGTTCAAANVGVVFGDCYYHLLASYDDGELSHYGPGALHLRELLAHAIGLKLKSFDFTIGDEPYKLEWSDTHSELCDYTAAASWRGAPACRLSNARRRAKRFIKQTPWAWRLVSNTRSAIGSLSSLRLARPRPSRAAIARVAPAPPALACVMGDMDLLRPAVAAGIPCAVVSRPGAPLLYSRYARSALAWDDFTKNVDGLLDALVSFGKAQAERPVLFYEEDAQLLLVSRHRERLSEAFRFVVADAALVEDLLDKAQFQVLAQRHQLPVPPARQFNPAATDPAELGLRFPLIIKPLTRLQRWSETLGLRKALEAKDIEALRALWPQLLALDLDLLAQELIPGAEAQIESYHCYVDQRGSIAGEFTGRKIRTFPLAYGHTTALEITACRGRARARPRHRRADRPDRRRQARFQARSAGQASPPGDKPPVQSLAQSGRARRRQYSGAGLCRSRRPATAGGRAGESRRALVPRLAGSSRGAGGRYSADDLGGMGLALRAQGGVVMGRSAAALARGAASPDRAAAVDAKRPQAQLDRIVKLALISDIHANLQALQATLDDIAAQSVDRIVCLGDIVGYNTNPGECIALVRRADCLCVAGNHDRAVSRQITTETFSNTAARAAAWTRERLGKDELAFLVGLPLKAEIAGELIAVHGALHPETGCEIVRLDNDESRGFSFER